MNDGQYEEFREQIGAEAAESLCAVYGGETIYVPNRRLQRIRQRDEAIRSAYEKGRSTKQLAEQYGLSQRLIRCIVYGYPKHRRKQNGAD